MKEQLISFETAKLAKEKGFDYVQLKYFHYFQNSEKRDDEGYLIEDGTGEWQLSEYMTHTKNEYPAPTQSLLQKWLREKHKIHIYLFPLDNGKWGFENNSILTNLDYIFVNYMYKGKEYNSYEEALEFALLEALK